MQDAEAPVESAAALMPDTAASQAIARPGMTCRYTVLTLRVGEARSLTNRAARLIPAATERSDDALHS